MPSVTYVNREHLGLERSLSKALAQGNILVSLTGATKSGKTVLCHHVLEAKEYVWIDGGAIRSEDDVWQRVASELKQPSETQETERTDRGVSLGAELGAGGGAVPSPQFRITAGGSRLKARETKTIVRTDTFYGATAALLENEITLVIDDFHYIDEKVREALVKGLKGLLFRGLKVVVLSTPNRAFEAIKAEVEITGRFKHVAVPDWSTTDLRQIASSGFRALNVECPWKIQRLLSTRRKEAHC